MSQHSLRFPNIFARYSAGFSSPLICFAKIILIYIQTVIKHAGCSQSNVELNMDTIMEMNQINSLNKLCESMVPARGRHIIYFIPVAELKPLIGKTISLMHKGTASLLHPHITGRIVMQIRQGENDLKHWALDHLC